MPSRKLIVADPDVTAGTLHAQLERLRAEADAAPGDARVPMRQLFALAKDHIDTPLGDVELLLEADRHDAKVVAVSIMDFQGRRRSTDEARRRELFDLYLRRHDRIDTWDLVDRSAPFVLGRYLIDKDRAPLYTLARSADEWRRRSAIVATDYLIRNDDIDDTFAIAELLVDDDADNVHKAVGGWVRQAGKRDIARLRSFLDQHAATMPRIMLRLAIEHLDPAERQHYLQHRHEPS